MYSVFTITKESVSLEDIVILFFMLRSSLSAILGYCMISYSRFAINTKNDNKCYPKVDIKADAELAQKLTQC